jgi:Family of unknown function (DUF6088)
MEFLHLGSRAAIDQALKRLKESKELMAIDRGVYVQPIKTRFGIRAPAAEKVIERFAATRAETVVPHGAAAANSLGLTTQVPTKLVFLTSGRNRTLKLGAQVVELKHAPHWMLLPPQRAGEAVRALQWIGEKGAAKALTALKQNLSPSTSTAWLRSCCKVLRIFRVVTMVTPASRKLSRKSPTLRAVSCDNFMLPIPPSNFLRRDGRALPSWRLGSRQM